MDVKVVTSYTHAAQVSQNTTYVKGARQRVEFPGMISIDQCELQRTLILSPAAKKFRVQPYAAAGPAPASQAGSDRVRSADRQEIVAVGRTPRRLGPARPKP